MEHQKLWIRLRRISELIAPTAHASKFTRQYGVLVRDNIPITIREWKKTKTEPVNYVCKRLKNMLWKKLMVNFTLWVAPEVNRNEVDRNEEDPNEEDSDDDDRHLNIIEQKVKKWTLSKMALQFNNWKKRLYKEFIDKEKTLVFTGAYEKIKDHWDTFVEYKTLEAAKKMLEINKKNATKKKYHHTMGQGGYKSGKPK
jgi:hypothetical protein